MAATRPREPDATALRRQVGGFRYALGEPTQGGYGAGPGAPAAGTPEHGRIVAFIRRRSPGGFLRLTRLPTRRLVYKALHFLFARHATSRIANAWTYVRQRQRVARVDYMPPLVFLDPSSKCNLRCPGCATGLGLARARAKAPLERMRTVIDQVAPTAVQVAFYHLGEPFLNDDVFEAIGYARAQGLWTLATSHLSLERPGLGREIVECGLHELQVSCDGATQAVYGQYRRGAQLERVWEHLREIREHRRRQRRRTPIVRAKMLVFEHNWHEARHFARLARRAGADEVQFFPGNGPEAFATGLLGGGTQFDVANLAWRVRRAAGPCEQVWQAMHITPDGGVLSCCLGYREADLFAAPGAALDVRGTWNSAPFVATRRYFLGQIAPSEAPANCRQCVYVQQYRRAGRGAPGGSP